MSSSGRHTELRRASSALLQNERLVAVLRANDSSEYLPVIDVLVSEGIRAIELTLSTSGTIEELPALLTRFGQNAEIGVGTVCTTSEAERAISAGANFLVTPVVVPEIIQLALAADIPIYPGGLSPTELHSAWSLGASAVKIFPAETVGPQYGMHLRGPFPGIQFVPSGGIDLEDIPEWLDAGALAVSLGGPLIGDAFRGGSLNALASRVQRARTLAERKEGTQ